MLLGARSISRSALMAVTGVGASNPLLTIREPVTVTCSTASPVPCAQADVARQRDVDINKVLATLFMNRAPTRLRLFRKIIRANSCWSRQSEFLVTNATESLI